MNLYYYLDRNGQQQGPIGADDLRKYGVTQNTKVWTQGMNQWEMAGSISELSVLIPPTITPPPFSTSQTPPPQLTVQSQKPDNFLVWSIIATVLCCIPTGIVAIIQSNRVNTCWEANDYAGANEASKNAKTWCFVSLGLGVVVFIIAFIAGIAEELY